MLFGLISMAQALELAGSAAVVLLMIGIAAGLGFRFSRRLDQSDLVALADAEGVRVDEAVLANNGRAALARLSDGRLMVARVMGADVSARFVAARAARIRLKPGRLDATFADVGFPPLHMKLDDSPAWLSELAGGGGTG